MFLAPRRPMMGIGMLGGPAYVAARVRQNQPPPAPPPAPLDLVGSLQHLASMRERGLLTQEEFDAAKARLLAS